MKQVMAVCVVAGMMATVAVAQDAKPGTFKNSVSIGATMTDGNSETLQVNATAITEGDKEGLGSFRAGLEANYGESTINSNRDTTVKNAKVFGNVKKTMSPRTFGSLDVNALYDDIAKIDYRLTVGPGLGAYLLKSEKTSLSFEVAPSYVWEDVADVQDSYFAIRFAERFSHALGGKSKVWESAEYLPRANDFGDYLLVAELGVEAPMSARVNLRLVVQDKYDSTPGAGLERNDLSLIAGVSLSL